MKITNICILFFLAWGAATGKADTEEKAATDTTQPIFPQQLTARDLLTYCASSSLTSFGRQRQKYCWGFISGVEETIRLTLRASGEPVALKICVPKRESSRNLAKAYIRYAGRRDTNLARPAAQIAIKALANSYTCLD